MLESMQGTYQKGLDCQVEGPDAVPGCWGAMGGL